MTFQPNGLTLVWLAVLIVLVAVMVRRMRAR